jgi:hypothetical protein
METPYIRLFAVFARKPYVEKFTNKLGRRLAILTLGLALCCASALAQSDRGTITGTVSDPVGAVVPSAPIQARNVDTGAVYEAAGSATGNYTLAQLPVGTYELTVTVPGFKRFVRQNIAVPVAQTVRIDINLEVGQATESVTITAEAPMLKTESGEMSDNVATERLDELPVLQIGAEAGTTGLRNEYSVLQLTPGTSWTADSSVRVNGMPSNTQSFRIDGQEAGSGIWTTQSWAQPGVDAVQEVALQTSNYAAEYGQAGGGVFNLTMKSGTNQFHGSAYDYFVNEALNAGIPYTDNGNGSLDRPRDRANDYGGTFGGPVWIPKVYNGHDKTFFFVNFEQFRQTIITTNVPNTVPTAAMRDGNFSSMLTGRVLGTDPATGQSIMENQIFDPSSDHLVNGVIERNPFPGNIVPASDFDRVALAIQNLIPMPNLPGNVNNYLVPYANPKTSTAPSFKIDHSISEKSKLSGFYSYTGVTTPNADMMPAPITSARGTDVKTNMIRLNFDQTLTPTLLLHVGAGYMDTNYLESVKPYNVESGIGLKGTYDPNLFPTIEDLFTAGEGGYGSFGGPGSYMGPFTQIQIRNLKPTANISLTWVKSNHTYKFGGEVVVDGYLNNNNTYAAPWIVFSPNETSNPAYNGLPLPGTAGVNYASFLTGLVDNGYTAVSAKTRLGKHSLAGFAEDSWKVTRTLTLDYGLRYDFSTYLKAHDGIMPNVGPNTPNPAAGDLPGGTVFEATCGCSFAHNYPFAFGPRLGLAYQVIPKTVVRAGIGVSYSQTEANNYQSYAAAANTPYQSPAFGFPAYQLQNGLPYQLTFPNFNPGQYPVNGVPASTLNFFDQNAGRPARTIQWSVGIQREIIPSIVVEATYVGNRGVWWQANYMENDNMITPSILAAHNLNIQNAADEALMLEPLSSVLGTPLAAAHNITLPYPDFPTSEPVNQAIRPYPEYTSMLRLWDPVGDTWYNALQTRATKRFSHGLQFGASFVWSKNETIGAESDVSFSSPVAPASNDILNRQQNKYLSGYDQPLVTVISGSYTLPKLNINKAASWFVRDWQLGALLRYSSGLPIMAPLATNGLSQLLFLGEGPGGFSGGTYMDPVPGQPLFLKNLNCGCYDPNGSFVLNPKAWANPAPGTWGTAAAYYNDYRYQRHPVENMSLARNFRVKERFNLQIRAEFTNIFNRPGINNPTSTNALATQIPGANGTGAGFGYISTVSTATTPLPRQGQLVARFTF